VAFDFEIGSSGPLLFFVISGFVIFMTLSRCTVVSDFTVSRFSRLYPAYWIAVLLTYTVGTIWPLPGQHYTVFQLLINFTMLQAYVGVPPIDDVYWTLNIEIFFYVTMLILFLLGLIKDMVFLSVIWLMGICGIYVLAYIGIDMPWTFQRLLYPELFVAGIVFYNIYMKGPSIARVALLGSCLSVHAFNHGLWSAKVVLVIFGLVAIAVSGRVHFLCVRPLIWLGTISYTLYITHSMIGFAVLRALTQDKIPSVAAIPITLIVAVTLASAMTYLIERPAMRAIRDIYKRKAGVPVPASTKESSMSPVSGTEMGTASILSKWARNVAPKLELLPHRQRPQA